MFPVEAIVRGYLTGSAWAEYKISGTVHGIKVRQDMVESEEFEMPLFTPSTKAEHGEHGRFLVRWSATQIYFFFFFFFLACWVRN